MDVNRGEITSVGDTSSPNKGALINRIVELATGVVYGSKDHSDQEVSELLSGLVKNKLLSAEDSYRLRDRLTDKTALDRLIDQRIDKVLSRRAS